MSRYLSVSRNPWDSTVLQGISLGSMDSAIELARRTEHLPPSGGTDGGEATNMPSVRMIRQLKDITRLRKELNALELEIRDRQFDQATADVVHLDVLEERNAKLEQLSAQLTDILQRKEELVTRLSKPFTGDHIEMDASCHKYAAELFTSMGSSVTKLPHNLDDISWSGQLAAVGNQLRGTLKDVSTSLTLCQGRFNQLLQSRKVLHQMQGEHGDNSCS